MARTFCKIRYSPKLALASILLCIVVVVMNMVDSRRNLEPTKSEKTGEIGLEIRRKRWFELASTVKEKARFSRVPDVIGIGVRKCGTGMLEHFIAQHPLVAVNMSEVHYYDNDLEKGLEYYKSKLPNATEDQLIMEKTPRYFISLPSNLPDILQGDSPEVKLILVLCDPVKRSYSDYSMRIRSGSKKANKTFEEYVDEYLPPVNRLFSSINIANDIDPLQFERTQKYLERNRCMFSFGHGIYAYFIKRWLEAFPPERILIVNGEQFIKDPGSVIEDVQDYLNIPKLILRSDFVRHPATGFFCLRRWWTETSDFDLRKCHGENSFGDLLCSCDGKGMTRSLIAKDKLSPEISESLREFFNPYNEMLYNMLDMRFDW